MLNLAATWEPSLVKKMAEIIGEECHAVGINTVMSPVVDISEIYAGEDAMKLLAKMYI